MDIQQILALYDKEQRQEVVYPGARREEAGRVVRHVQLGGEEAGMVMYSRLDPATVDEAIREQVAYYESIGQDFEWKTYSHDQPADLVDRLAAYGFTVEEPETLLALDLADAPAVLFEPVTAEVRRITDPALIGEVEAVESQVWTHDMSGLFARLADDLRQTPDLLSVYVAYVDGEPASAAWQYFHPPSQFASLWGGSTRPAYRGRGLYTALLAVRAQEARARGVRFLTVDASPMSRPILEKRGFQVLGITQPCKWYCKHSK